ncbi:MAG: endolytic transglycosylase MltG [Gallicola sp.]|uniref:hypothetical protein n=1 Tax=Gallicola sp. Sow4_E12 TaxID=3438785 RepID=UPI001854E601|nr:endolytic transglycosylase MltG [Gallicola sp.]
MRKFIGRVKDTLYDLNHLMWILIIILAMGIIISFQTYDLFSRDYTTSETSVSNSQSPVSKVAEEPPSEIQVTIPEGATYLDAAKILIDANIIKDEESFVKLIQEKKLEEGILPGSYTLTQGMDYEELLQVLTTES